MTETEELMQERDDLQAKIGSARSAAKATGASEREKSDLMMLEQKLQALEQRIAHTAAAVASKGDKPKSSADTMEKKLDGALKDSFPGSDPVAFIEGAPSKPADRS
jgi:hypothetical protein